MKSLYALAVIAVIPLGLAIGVQIACQTQPPAPGPVPPEAGDAAPGSCQAACNVLAALCGVSQPATCAGSLQRAQDSQLVRLPDGGPLTCSGLASARSSADIRAMGQPCGP